MSERQAGILSKEAPFQSPTPDGESMAQDSPAVLDEIVRRVVDVAEPQRIILFGSAARGETSSDSDVDLLVVKEGAHRRKLAQAIYRRLYGVGRAVDVVVVTPEDIERYRHAVGLVIGPALEEGKTIYAA
jgi:predicted nucleotidyltransferase